MGIPWFRGSEEAYKTALIKSEREMQALGQLGGASGSLFGTMRQQRKDEEDAALLEEKLQATIGPQTEAAKASTEQPGESGQDDSPLASTAPTMAAPPVDTSEPGTLQRLAGGLEENGLRMLRAGGGMLGLTSQRTPKLLDSARRIAGMEGKIAGEQLLNKRLHAVQGAAQDFAEPGEFYRRATGGRFDMGDLKAAPPRTGGGGIGGYRTLAELEMAAHGGMDPIAKMVWDNLTKGRSDTRRDFTNPPARKFDSPLQNRAYGSLMQGFMQKGLSAWDANSMIPDEMVTALSLNLTPGAVDGVISQAMLRRGGVPGQTLSTQEAPEVVPGQDDLENQTDEDGIQLFMPE